MRKKPSEIIRVLKKCEGTVLAAAVELGVHPATVYRWRKRARKPSGYLAIFGAERKSTRPHTIRYALKGESLKRLLEARKKYGWTAEKLQPLLGLKVCVRTIQRTLKRHGLVRESNYYRRPRLQPTIHMHSKNTTAVGYLQMDVKVVTPQLSGLPWTCFEYAVIDIFSRYKDAVILNQLDQDGAICALLEILPRLPFRPVFIQTDNGLEFQKKFLEFVTAQGLKHHFVHKRSPNENAIIERSFRTDEEEFFFRMEHRPKHYDDLREQFAKYLRYYNYERLHLGINLKTPIEIVAHVLSD
jgi:transposase InsO family protein